MPIVVDASVIIAVIANEPIKSALIALTRGEELFAPRSLPWEIVNAFSAMFKRKAIELPLASAAVDEFLRIPIRYVDIDLQRSLELSHSLNVYAYDAFMIACAEQLGCGLITLDRGLVNAARRAGIDAVEVAN